MMLIADEEKQLSFLIGPPSQKPGSCAGKKGCGLNALRQAGIGGHVVIAEIEVGAAVKIVAAGSGDDVDRARAAIPVDASKFTDESWNSCTTSCEKFMEVPPSTSSLMMPPSMVRRARRCRRPPPENGDVEHRVELAKSSRGDGHARLKRRQLKELRPLRGMS